MAGNVNPTAACLFAILFLWQLPHSHAISLFRAGEYSRAGVVTLNGRIGPASTWNRILILSALQAGLGSSLVYVGAASWAYGATALLMGLLLVASAWNGRSVQRSTRLARQDRGELAARRYFRATLLYLTVLAAALIVDSSFIVGR